MSSRVMPRRLAIRSAAVNWSGRSMSHDAGRSTERSGPALAPSPIALIASMPQAMPMSMAPAAIRPAIRWLACCPLPHWQSTVVAPTCSGRPATSHADPGDVVGLLGELRDAAADHLLDLAGVDAGLLHDRPLHSAEKLGRMQAGQPSVPLADRAAGGFNDDRVTHSARLEHVSLVCQAALQPSL